MFYRTACCSPLVQETGDILKSSHDKNIVLRQHSKNIQAVPNVGNHQVRTKMGPEILIS